MHRSYKTDRTYRSLIAAGVLALSGLAMIILTTSPARAQSARFLVDKSILDMELIPGFTHRDIITVVNQEDTALPMNVELSLWDVAENTDANFIFTEAEGRVNPTQWFFIESEENFDASREDDVPARPFAPRQAALLDPGQQYQLRYSIKPPMETPAGTYLVAMRFQAVFPDHYFSDNGPRLLPEIVTLFFLKVSLPSLEGESAPYDASIVAMYPKNQPLLEGVDVLTANAGILDEAAHVFVAKIKNEGLYHFRTAGTIEVRNWYGRVVASAPLPHKYILSGRVRTLEVPVLEEKEKGFFSNLAAMIRKNMYFGPYTAALRLELPALDADMIGSSVETELIIAHELSFFIIPWKFWLPIFAVIALFLFGIKRYRRRVVLAFKVLFGKGT